MFVFHYWDFVLEKSLENLSLTFPSSERPKNILKEFSAGTKNISYHILEKLKADHCVCESPI